MRSYSFINRHNRSLNVIFTGLSQVPHYDEMYLTSYHHILQLVIILLKCFLRGAVVVFSTISCGTCDLHEISCVAQQPSTHSTAEKKSHPSNVGTPSWRVPCRRGTCRPRGCRALYRCRDAISLSLLFSVSRLSSVGSRVRRSKFSSKIPRANGPYPEGNVNKC